MTKTLLATALVLLSFQAAKADSDGPAKSQGRILSCGQLQDYEGKPVAGAPSYRLLEKEDSFSIEETQGSTVQVFETEARDGDEDYTSYYIIQDGASKFVQAVTVQWDLEWAHLGDNGGYSVNNCVLTKDKK